MALYNFGIAPTGVCLRFKLFDSSSASGAGLTGLAYNTTNLKIAVNQLVRGNTGAATAYLYTGANIEDISTLGVWAGPSTSKCRFKEVDATNQPGVYEIQLANSVCGYVNDSTLPLSLLVSIGGAVTNLAQQDFLVECTNQNVDKTGYALTSAYDAAKNAASQSSVDTVDGVVDAIKAKTDNLPASPAAVGSAMTLADDAITASKFDEFSAFPLTERDAAGTAVARTGATAATMATLAGQLDGVQTSVNGISNVTRLSVALFEYLQRPASGSKYVKVEVALKDNSGAMEDPDGNQLALTVYNPAGTSRNGLLYKDGAGADALADGSGTFSAYKKLEKAATGLYFFYYKVTDDATEEELTFKFGWEESSAALYEYRASQVCDAANDLSAIRLQTDKIPASPAAVGSAMTLSSGERLAVADAVWDELLSGHEVSGSAGLALSNSGGALDAAATAAAVWGALRATYSGSGTFGEYTRASLERVAGSSTVDTLTITAWFENILAHATGDVVRSVNTYDYKKQDGVTTAFSFTSSAGGRS